MTASSLMFSTQLDDPQDLSPVADAFCVLAEVHLNYETKALLVGFKCWRSKQAYDAGRKAFELIRVELSPDKGGVEFFDKANGADASVQLGSTLLAYLINSGKLAGKPIHVELKD